MRVRLLQPLVASDTLGLWPHPSNLRLRLHVASSLCVSSLICSSKDTSQDLGPTLTQDDLIQTSAETLFPMRSHL